MPIDNREDNAGIPVGYNKFLNSRSATEDAWYVFCHEDWQPEEPLLNRFDGLDRESLWGVVGASTRIRFGFYHQWLMVGSVEECQKDGSGLRTIGTVVPEGSLVETFDCQCLIVHSSLVRKCGLRFDENLTFDLYAEEFCMAAHRLGIASRIVPLKARHWSQGCVQPRYFEQERYVDRKYPDMCVTGTSSWSLGGRFSLGRRLTIVFKKLLLR